MQLDSAFDVTAPIDQVWSTLMDFERVAACLPGAQVLDTLSEDAYQVGMKVKLGPVTMQYKGQLDVLERVPDEHRAVLRGKAKEARGQGTAEATAQLALTTDGTTTRGTVTADVNLSGRAAAMGQGVISTVTEQMMAQFAKNLQALLASTPEAPAAATTAAGKAPAKAASKAPAKKAAPRKRTAPKAGTVAANDTVVTVAADGSPAPATSAPATSVPAAPSTATTASATVTETTAVAPPIDAPTASPEATPPNTDTPGADTSTTTHHAEAPATGTPAADDTPAGATGASTAARTTSAKAKDSDTAGSGAAGSSGVGKVAGVGVGGVGSSGSVAADGGPAPRTVAPVFTPAAADDNALDAVALARAIAEAQLREPKKVLGLLALVAFLAFLFGKRRGKRAAS